MNEQTPIVWPGWQTVRTIGRGSYGTVYEVERTLYGHTEKAAVKCISLPRSRSELDDLFSDGYDAKGVAARYENLLQGIVQEYNLMAELKSCRNVVSCEDIACQRQDNGLGWDVKIKMELLTPMNRALPVSVPEGQVLRIGRDLAAALSLCHARKIVHRDIKPQNIFVSDGGDYKLGDFGIARTMEKTTGATRTGTYNYMAPEVYNNQPYGHQADVYSLGLVLYWLLNERRGPFLPLPPQVPTASQEEQARLRRFGGEALPPPKNGSPALRRLVLWACAFDPARRCPDAETLLRELDSLAQGAGKERIAASGGVAEQNPSGPAGRLPYRGRQEKPADQYDKSAEQERIATPVTRSPVRNDKAGAMAQGKDPSTPAAPPLRMTASTPLRAAPVYTPARQAPARKNHTGLIVGILAAAAAALLLIALALLPAAKKSSGSARTDSAASEAAAATGNAAASAGEAAAQAADGAAPAVEGQEQRNVPGESFSDGALTYTFAGTALTVTGSGKLSDPAEAVPDWAQRRGELTALTVGEGVTQLGIKAFSGCTALQTAALPDSLQLIGSRAFADCAALREVSLGSGLTAVDDRAFAGCTALQSLAFPEGVRALGGGLFLNCTALEEISLPRSIQTIFYYYVDDPVNGASPVIAYSPFAGCTAFRTIRYAGTAAEWGQVDLHYGSLPEGVTVVCSDANITTLSFVIPENPLTPYGKAIRRGFGEGVSYTDEEKIKAITDSYYSRSAGEAGGYRDASNDNNATGYRLGFYYADGLLYYAEVIRGQYIDVKLYYWGDKLIALRDYRYSDGSLCFSGSPTFDATSREFDAVYGIGTA